MDKDQIAKMFALLNQIARRLDRLDEGVDRIRDQVADTLNIRLQEITAAGDAIANAIRKRIHSAESN